MKTPQELLAQVEAHLQQYRAQQLQGGTLYAPMEYILALGGKRLRPVLFLLGHQAIDGRPIDHALPASLSVELFHNFSLLHDDIMDNAPIRRGKPTVHEKWDTNTAILAGDAMFALAYGQLIQGFPQHAAALVQEFTRVSVGVCEGQMEDMEMAAQPTATIPAYIEMIRKKTAVLIGGSLSLGAIAAGADPHTTDLLRAYGEAAGIGFQLHDDYLDVFATTAKSGKQVAGDIIEGKKTYLLLRAFEKATPQQHKELTHLIHHETDPNAKVQGVKHIYAQLHIAQDTEAQMQHHFNQAAHFGQALAHLPGFPHLQHFMHLLRQRDH